MEQQGDQQGFELVAPKSRIAAFNFGAPLDMGPQMSVSQFSTALNPLDDHHSPFFDGHLMPFWGNTPLDQHPSHFVGYLSNLVGGLEHFYFSIIYGKIR
jgi:hypothetical protein